MTRLRVLLPLLVVAGIGLAGCVPPDPPPPPPPAPAPSGVDLVATDIWWPTPLIVGARVPFSVTVQNFGDTPTPANTIVDVLVTIDGVDVGWSDNVRVPLAPGFSRVQVVNGGPDGSDGLWTVTAGSHSVRAFVNSGSLPARAPIPESDHENNKLTEVFEVPVTIDISTVGVTGVDMDPRFFENSGIVFDSEVFVGFFYGDDAIVQPHREPITATFASPVSSISVSFAPGYPGTATYALVAYSASGRVLSTSTTTVIQPPGEGYATLRVADFGSKAKRFSISTSNPAMEFGVNQITYEYGL